jgi:hypothetical protein
MALSGSSKDGDDSPATKEEEIESDENDSSMVDGGHD